MHTKYWKRLRIMAPFEGEGSAGGAPAPEDFAAFFDGGAGSDDDQPAAQAGAESQEDAAARLAADDAAQAAQASQQPDAQATSDDPAAAQPQKFTVEVDGKPIELTAAEMSAHVKAGMRQAEPARQPQPDQGDPASNPQAQARAQRDQQAHQVNALAQRTAAELQMLKGQLTDELAQTNPTQFLRIKNAVEARQDQLQQAHQFLNHVGAERQQEQAAAMHAHLEAQHNALIKKLPDWADPVKAKAETDKIKDYMIAEGYKPQELSITDHRNLLMVRKAMLYDGLMARAAEAKSKVAAAPAKVERPGTPAVAPTDGRTAAMRDLAKTGSRDAAARVFADMFG